MSDRSIPLEWVDDAAQPRDASKRLARLRRLSWVLDRSIPIGNKRFGLDPILGLIPGIGDWIASVLSLYVLYEAARLGLPKHVLGRMAANIGVEAVVGSVPVLGDLFDFAWQANARNVRLIDQHYQANMPARPIGRLVILIVVGAVLLLIVTFTIAFLLAQWLWSLLT